MYFPDINMTVYTVYIYIYYIAFVGHRQEIDAKQKLVEEANRKEEQAAAGDGPNDDRTATDCGSLSLS